MHHPTTTTLLMLLCFVLLTTANKILPPLCHPQDWPRASTKSINIVWQYINDFHGRYHVDAHHCADIACHDEAHVLICNDNNYAIDSHSDYIKTYVVDVLQNCQVLIGQSWTGASAQVFDTDGYNVIVRGKTGSDWKCTF